jgi:hypothetical protein
MEDVRTTACDSICVVIGKVGQLEDSTPRERTHARTHDENGTSAAIRTQRKENNLNR